MFKAVIADDIRSNLLYPVLQKVLLVEDFPLPPTSSTSQLRDFTLEEV
jgi:hypothetical protein